VDQVGEFEETAVWLSLQSQLVAGEADDSAKNNCLGDCCFRSSILISRYIISAAPRGGRPGRD
jgi:hypothetical protein